MCSFHSLQTSSYLRGNSLLVWQIGNIAARDKTLYFLVLCKLLRHANQFTYLLCSPALAMMADCSY